MSNAEIVLMLPSCDFLDLLILSDWDNIASSIVECSICFRCQAEVSTFGVDVHSE